MFDARGILCPAMRHTGKKKRGLGSSRLSVVWWRRHRFFFSYFSTLASLLLPLSSTGSASFGREGLGGNKKEI